MQMVTVSSTKQQVHQAKSKGSQDRLLGERARAGHLTLNSMTTLTAVVV